MADDDADLGGDGDDDDDDDGIATRERQQNGSAARRAKGGGARRLGSGGHIYAALCGFVAASLKKLQTRSLKNYNCTCNAYFLVRKADRHS